MLPRIARFRALDKGASEVSRRLLIGLIAAMFALAACGGGGDGASSTTPDDGETPTTQEAPATDTTSDDDDGETVGIGDLPQECVDAFVGYLREIEPFVEGVDWENATSADFEELSEELDAVTTDYEAEISDSNCDDLEVDASAEESIDYMIELAQREAPGTVAYFEMIRDFTGEFGGESDIVVANDCETDIETLQAIVDEGMTMQDRPGTDIIAIGSLITSITTNCELERSGEFFAQEDVTDFMGG